MRFQKFVLGVIGAGMMFVSVPVMAQQNTNSLQMRMDRIERDIQTLSRSVYKGDVPPPSVTHSSGMDSGQAAAMDMRMGQIEEQLRRLTGMVEETQFTLRQLEKNGGTASMPKNTDAVMTQPLISNGSTQTPSNQLGTLGEASAGMVQSPAALYDQAFSFMQKNDYASAQGALDQFLEQYPDHDLAANAKYWLGETYYARGDYQGASRAFALSYKDFPNGNKAPDSLLKLAMSLKQQDMTQEACLTLAEIDKQFPNAPASIKTRALKENQDYGCE